MDKSYTPRLEHKNPDTPMQASPEPSLGKADPPTCRRPAAFFAVLLLTLFPASQAATITGMVVSVADGDTITLLDNSQTQHKIRLGGIDAPEKAQPYGQQSIKASQTWCSARR